MAGARPEHDFLLPEVQYDAYPQRHSMQHSSLVSYPSEVSTFDPKGGNDHVEELDSLTSTISLKTATSHERNDTLYRRRRQYWSSPWLRHTTLLLFAALFACLAASLVILRRIDISSNGFSPNTSHYAWTYGPTAVFTVVLSLWRQVDYHVKMMQPWQELKRSSTASNTVLLDYIAPLNITSLFKALRKCHLPVVFSILGFILLKVVLLFSTGLLILSTSLNQDQATLPLTTSFHITDKLRTTLNTTFSLFSEDRKIPVYDNLSPLPVHTYAGVLSGELPYPEGTRDFGAFQSYQLETDLDVQSLSLTVDVFQPNISCEIANITLIQQSNATNSPIIQLTTETCSVGGPGQVPLSMLGFSCTSCPKQQIQYYFERVNCSQKTAPVQEEWMTLTPTTPYDLRYAFWVTNVTFRNVSYVYNETLINDPDDPSYTGNTSNQTWIMQNATGAIQTSHQAAAVICKADYTMASADLLHQLVTDSINISNLQPQQQFKEFSNLMLGEMIYASLYEARGLLVDGVDGWTDRMYETITTPLYHMILQTLDGSQSMDRLLSAATLAQGVVQSWNGIATQWAHENLIQPSSDSTVADVLYMEDRLHVSTASWIIMLVGCLVLVVLSVSVLWTTRSKLIPSNPATIATYAAILAASPRLQQHLQDAGQLRTSQLTTLLQDVEFRTVAAEHFRIETTLGAKPVKPKKPTWKPLAGRWYMIVLTLMIPIAVIIALEVLYMKSEANDGIVDVTQSESSATYLSRYIAALVMFLTATCFTALDFAIALFAPYTLMRFASEPARRSIQFQILGELPPVALFRSLKARHFSSVFSNLAALIGSVLAVVASGLFIVDKAVIVRQPIQASLMDTFNITWHNSSRAGDAGAGVRVNQVDWNETIVPTTIWQNVVMPNIADIRSTQGNALVAGNYTLKLDSLLPYLDCDIIPDEQVNVTFGWYDGEAQVSSVSATVPLEPRCQHAGINGTGTSYNLYHEWDMANAGQTLYTGAFHDLHLGPWWTEPGDPVPDYGEGPGNMVYQDDNPVGCPSIGVILARDVANADTPDDATVLVCSQRIKNVTLEVTYIGDTGAPTISSEESPFVIGESGYLTNGTDGFDSFPYRVETYLSTSTGNLTYIETGNTVDNPLDEYLDHVVHGQNGTAVDKLAGKSNREVFKTAVENLYARYMSLVIDLKFRQPINDSTLAFGTMAVNTSRLKVNFTSKLILQIMLALMILFGAAAFWLSDLRGTLPRKPSSIASTMGFLAGSDLVEQFKTGELIDVRRLEGNGWMFGLGWWKQSDNQKARRFGIDVDVPEQSGYRDTRWAALRRRVFSSRRSRR